MEVQKYVFLNSVQVSVLLGTCTACEKVLGIHWIGDWSD
jgi:hypothetical protein